MTMNQLAQQIKKLRTGQNLSQDDLAENSIFPVRLFQNGKMAKQRQISTNWSSWQKSLVSVWIIWF